MKLKTLLAAVPLCAGLMFAQTPSNDTTTGQSTTGQDLNRNTGQNTTGQDLNRNTGQNADINRSTRGNSMYGILVASGCNSSSMNGAWSNSGQNASNWNNNHNGASYNASDKSSTSASAMDRTTNAAGGGDLHRSDVGSANRTENGTTGDTNLKSSTASNQIDQSGSMPRGTQPGDLNRNTVGDKSVNNPQTGMADRDKGGDTNATTGSQMADRNHGAGQEWQSGASNTGQWDKGCFISPTTTSFVFLTKDGRQVRLDDASNSMVQQKLSSSNRVQQKSKIFRVRVNGDMTGDTLHITDIQM
jgi:hypothetical protein